MLACDLNVRPSTEDDDATRCKDQQRRRLWGGPGRRRRNSHRQSRNVFLSSCIGSSITSEERLGLQVLLTAWRLQEANPGEIFQEACVLRRRKKKRQVDERLRAMFVDLQPDPTSGFGHRRQSQSTFCCSGKITGDTKTNRGLDDFMQFRAQQGQAQKQVAVEAQRRKGEIWSICGCSPRRASRVFWQVNFRTANPTAGRWVRRMTIAAAYDKSEPTRHQRFTNATTLKAPRNNQSNCPTANQLTCSSSRKEKDPCTDKQNEGPRLQGQAIIKLRISDSKLRRRDGQPRLERENGGSKWVVGAILLCLANTKPDQE